MNKLDSLTIKEDVLLSAEVRVRRPSTRRRRSLPAGRGAQSVQNIFVGHNRCALSSVSNIPGEIAAGDRAARLAEILIPARMVGMEMRVDDITNRLV